MSQMVMSKGAASRSAGPARLPVGEDAQPALSAMRALLSRARPASDSEALGVLRRAFPETSLTERVRAVDTYRW